MFFSFNKIFLFYKKYINIFYRLVVKDVFETPSCRKTFMTNQKLV
ncbi:hypothetical protein LM80661_110004 [Listeria monocytogenes]|nr:hypothetical protein LM80661_110004 [Listeria monocytogenes]